MKPETSPAPTVWAAFAKANLAPTEIVCQAYHPVHPSDTSCHTRLVCQGTSIATHAFEREHGGGFSMTLATCAKEHPIWKQLTGLNIDLVDLRCDVCDQQIQPDPKQILKHLKPHIGKNRRTLATKKVWFTVQTAVLPPEDQVLVDGE